MTFTSAARALLRRLEACRLTAYPDAGGVWTIGWGHVGPEVVPGLVWTQEHADAVFEQDLQRFVIGVADLAQGVAINDDRFSALVIFSYNVGLVEFAHSVVWRDVLAGRFNKVPSELMRWVHVHDPVTHRLVIDPDLVIRRQAEVALWNTSRS